MQVAEQHLTWELSTQIEKLRQKLQHLTEEGNFQNIEDMRLSQEIDKLIVKYYRDKSSCKSND